MWTGFQKFSRGGGGGEGSDEVSHGQIFSWIRAWYCHLCDNLVTTGLFRVVGTIFQQD